MATRPRPLGRHIPIGAKRLEARKEGREIRIERRRERNENQKKETPIKIKPQVNSHFQFIHSLKTILSRPSIT
jgi:hypothetical protein